MLQHLNDIDYNTYSIMLFDSWKRTTKTESLLLSIIQLHNIITISILLIIPNVVQSSPNISVNTNNSSSGNATTGTAAVATMMFVSFMAGIATASIVYYLKDNKKDSSVDDNDNISTTAMIRDRVLLWKESSIERGDELLTQLKESYMDLENRIGELPATFRRRTHWPWDKMRRKKSDDVAEKEELSESKHSTASNKKGEEEVVIQENHVVDGREIVDTNATTVEEKKETDDDILLQNNNHTNNDNDDNVKKSSWCIGSIFGMDVGGTLAKLVYLEQQNEGITSRREKAYRNRASAQAVVMARRGYEAHFSFHEDTTSCSDDHCHHIDSYDNDDDNNSNNSSSTCSSLENDNGHNHNNQHDYNIRHHHRHISAKDRRALFRPRSKSHSGSSSVWKENEKSSINIQNQSNKKASLSKISTSYSKSLSSSKSNNNTIEYQRQHSSASNEDLYNLSMLRQESVPDDLHLFADVAEPIFRSKSSSPKNSSKKEKHSNDEDDDILNMYEDYVDYDADNDDNNMNNKTKNNEIVKNKNNKCGDSVDDDNDLPSPNNDESLDTLQDLPPSTPKTDKSNSLNKAPGTPSSSMRRVRSMFDFATDRQRDREQALDRFYNFAKRLDSYPDGVRDHKLSFYNHELGGEFHFIRFETRRMQSAMDLIRANKLHLNIHEMGCTGGGAHKFANEWKNELGIVMKKQDELDSLVVGMQFVLSTVVGECYTFRPREPKKDNSHHSRNNSSHNGIQPRDQSNDNNNNNNSSRHGSEDDGYRSDEEGPVSDSEGQGDEWWWSRKVQRDTISYSSTYPYLVVSIGTGVSVLRVDGPRKYERVSGSTIGGGTYYGLIRLLTDVEDFDDIMRLAERGDPSKVDMLVGDIYGQNSDALEKLGLPSSLVASSFGKLVAKDDPAAGLKQEDLARALLLMITINIGQVAHLNAKLFNTHRIYFVGNFLRHNKISQRRLSFAINYWSKGEMEALFLEHEGYFGALGAFLLAQKEEETKIVGNNDEQRHRRSSSVLEGLHNNNRKNSTINNRLSEHRRSTTISEGLNTAS